MKTKSLTILLSITMLFISGCSASSIDARKQRAEQPNKNTVMNELTDKDIFGNEATLNVSEADIQDALESTKFTVPLKSLVILVQSGSKAPEVAMQQELSKYYSVSSYSGIADKKKTSACNKDSTDVENMNYMQALRYIAAKGKHKAILVYWGNLEAGRLDPQTKEVNWSDYKNEKNIGTGIILRYLLRFALVDVATGEWATYSPANYEYSEPLQSTNAVDITKQQIMQLKKNTYERAVADLVNRFK